jgi:hypothetical protein
MTQIGMTHRFSKKHWIEQRKAEKKKQKATKRAIRKSATVHLVETST